MIIVAVVLFSLTVSLPTPMLRLPAAVPVIVAESLPASALMVPAAPLFRVMESLPAPMFNVPALAEIVAESAPEPRVIFSTLEKLT